MRLVRARQQCQDILGLLPWAAPTVIHMDMDTWALTITNSNNRVQWEEDLAMVHRHTNINP